MAKRMLIDAAHPEETRVVVLSGHRLEEFDFETSTKKQIKGNIYLAKVTRVEPSLQAAFVEYGGNRHGFLAFGEIHPDYYRIPVADRRAAIEDERAAEEAENEREERHVEEGEEEAPESEAEESRADHLAETAPFDVMRGPEAEDQGFAGDEDDDEEEPLPESAAASPERAEESAEEDDSEAGAPADLSLDPSAPPAFSTPSFEPGPQDDAFAADDSTGGAEPASDREAIGAPHDDETAVGEVDFEDAPALGAPSEDAAVAATPRASIETLGGDEVEEATRRRARPYRHYKIQEVIKRRQIMLVQVTKEERGNKGAALTTYISLAGRYCVLMPNTPRGGGVSRKITSLTDRRRLKDLMSDLDVPEGMGVIVRTAGSERSKAEIKRDFEYLMRLWEEIRDLTLKSTAPAMIYEEGNLIKRSIRDLYASDLEEVLVDGKDGYEIAKSFMKMLMPSHARRVRFYNDPAVPLFQRFQVEGQLDAIHSATVQLRSGGYIVINPTEALVAIDVNSGRSTRERNIEETALKTNLEASEEIARQLRLRDLAGLIVIDYIDMEEHRNNGAVERRLKDAMRHDRARIQVGRISPFGLLELSRQRLRPSLLEASTEPCPHCAGTGHIRSTESTALHVLRAIEEEGMRRRSAEIGVAVPAAVALYILNQKRGALQQIEARYGFHVFVTEDDTLVPPAFRLERVRALTPSEIAALPVPQPLPMPPEEPEATVPEASEASEAPARHGHQGESEEGERWLPQEEDEGEEAGDHESGAARESAGEGQGRSRRRRRRRRRGGERGRDAASQTNHAQEGGESEGFDAFGAEPGAEPGAESESEAEAMPGFGSAEGESESERAGEQADGDGEHRRRRRGRRGGRRRRRGHGGEGRDDENGVGENGGETGFAEAGSAADEGEAIAESAIVAAEFEEAREEERFVPEIEMPSTPPTVPEPAPEPAPQASVAPPAAPAPEAETQHEEPTPAAESTAQETSEEAERAPSVYNIPEAQEISGPAANPRRGWWRRR
jgi:ribonuclease E